MNITTTLKEKIKQLMDFHGPQFVAGRLGVHVTAVYRWKNGRSGITCKHVDSVETMFHEMIGAPYKDDVLPVDTVNPVTAVIDLATANPDKMRLRISGLFVTGVDFIGKS